MIYIKEDMGTSEIREPSQYENTYQKNQQHEISSNRTKRITAYKEVPTTPHHTHTHPKEKKNTKRPQTLQKTRMSDPQKIQKRARKNKTGPGILDCLLQKGYKDS